MYLEIVSARNKDSDCWVGFSIWQAQHNLKLLCFVLKLYYY